MTKEEKNLLEIDYCSRIPYMFGLRVQYGGKDYSPFGYGAGRVPLMTSPIMSYTSEVPPLEEIKLYLRPLSNMTEKEYEELKNISGDYGFPPLSNINDWEPNYAVLDWLNSHFFDYRGLIEKGLALEAPEDMYSFFKKL